MHLKNVQPINNLSAYKRHILIWKVAYYKENIHSILAKWLTGYKLAYLLDIMNNWRLSHTEIEQMSSIIEERRLLIEKMTDEIVRLNIDNPDVIDEIIDLKRMIWLILYNVRMSQRIISEWLPLWAQRIGLQIARRINTSNSTNYQIQ